MIKTVHITDTLRLFIYRLTDGGYLAYKSQVAAMIGVHHSTLTNYINHRRYLKPSDARWQCRNLRGKKAISIDAACDFWQYQSSRGNKTAQFIEVELLQKPLLFRCNDVFKLSDNLSNKLE